jgi:nucleotidyltransferase/DNA polymerase involved in DNA repair
LFIVNTIITIHHIYSHIHIINDILTFFRSYRAAMVFLHIDVDCFYCQCEVVRNPALRGVPVAVSQHNAGGFVAISYEAKACGVQKADGVGAAGRANLPFLKDRISREEANAKCGGRLVIIEMDMRRYKAFSRQLFEEIESFFRSRGAEVPVEQSSIDDFFVEVSDEVIDSFMDDADGTSDDRRNRWYVVSDCTSYPPQLEEWRPDQHGSLYAREMLFVQMLRTFILEKIGFSISVGIAENKLIARLLSPLHKPDCQVCLDPQQYENFMTEFPLQSIPSLKGKLGDSFLQAGYSTANDVRKLSMPDICAQFCQGNAKKAQWIYEAVRGQCSTVVEPRGPPKTIIVERSFVPGTDVPAMAKFLCDELLLRISDDGREPSRMDVKWRVGYAAGGRAGVVSRSVPWPGRSFGAARVLAVIEAPLPELTRLVVGASGFSETMKESGAVQSLSQMLRRSADNKRSRTDEVPPSVTDDIPDDDAQAGDPALALDHAEEEDEGLVEMSEEVATPAEQEAIIQLSQQILQVGERPVSQVLRDAHDDMDFDREQLLEGNNRTLASTTETVELNRKRQHDWDSVQVYECEICNMWVEERHRTAHERAHRTGKIRKVR